MAFHPNSKFLDNVTSDIQAQINSINVVAGSNISIIESPINTWTISSSGGATSDITRSEVASISANLQSQIIDISGSLATTIVGKVTCNTSNSKYTITHTDIDVSSSIPVISLTIPNSGSTLYVQGILNRSNTGFDVMLSSIPESSGYFINWHLSTLGNVNGGGGGGSGSISVKVGNTTISNVTTLELSGAAVTNLIDNGNGNVTAVINVTGSIDQGTLTTTTTYITGNAFTPDDTSVAYSYTLNDNSTLYCPTNMTDGSTKVIRFVQPPSSNYSLSFGNTPPYVWKFSNGNAPVLTPVNGAIDVLTILRIQNDIYVTIIKNFTE